ncbi:MAG: hypothetical protein M3R45_06130 [Pseudomonadota bacterium]|nr:hypothetical protein [Pseudomonadota bacterium]
MTSLSAVSLDLTGVTFFKTPAGLQEIQSRTLGLPALIRRVLVLVDGKRSGKELAAFAGGEENIQEVLSQLMEYGCIDAQGSAKPAPAATATVAVAATVAKAAAAAPGQPDYEAELAGLPQIALRTPKELEMARNFMVNTTNSIFGQNTRLSLIKSILACQGAAQLRQVYPDWARTMASHSASAKRLPELRERLFAVL